MSNGYETPTHVGGGSRGGRGGQTSVGSPDGQDLDLEQIILNHKIARLDMVTGGHQLFQLDNEGIMQLLLADIAIEDFDQAIDDALGMVHKNKAVEYLEGMDKERQKWYYDSLPVMSQQMLTRTGYERPKKGRFTRAVDKLQELQSKIPILGKVQAKWGIAPISTIGGVLSTAAEGTLDAIHADINQAARTGRTLSHTFTQPSRMWSFGELGEFWEMAEFAETNFAPEAVTAARDQLDGNEEALNIMLSQVRHGDALEGTLAYFEKQVDGDLLKARQLAEAFLKSPTVASTGWYGASRYLNSGNIRAVSDFPVYALRQTALQIPPAFGGARIEDLKIGNIGFEGLKEKYKQGGDYLSAEEGWVPEHMWHGSQGEQLALSKSGWPRTTEPIVIGVTELAAIIMLSPLNTGMTALQRILRARAGVKAPHEFHGGYQKQIHEQYVATSAQRAMDDLAGLGKDATIDEILAKFPQLVKENVTHRSGMSAGELKDVMIAWAKKNVAAGDMFFARSSWWRRQEVRSLNRKIDQIVHHFRMHEEWLIQQQIRVTRGQAGSAPYTGSPVWELAQQDVRFKPLIESMLKYHDEAKLIRGNRKVEFFEMVPDPTNPAEYIMGQAKKLGVGKPGLDEFDGWWSFLNEADGASALLHLGGRSQVARYYPRLSYASRIKLRHNLFKRKWLGTAKDNLNSVRSDTFAMSVEESLGYQEQIIAQRVFGELSKGGNRGLQKLTEQEVIQAVTDFPMFEERARATAGTTATRIEQGDVADLKSIIEAEKDRGYETLYKVYRDVIVGNKTIQELDYLNVERTVYNPETGQDDIVIDTSLKDYLSNETLPYIDEYLTAHVSTVGIPRFNEKGLIKYPNTKKALFREGKRFVENMKRGLITTPGSLDNELLLRIPMEITPRSTKTWLELSESGLEVGPMRLNLEKAKISTPKQFQNLIDEKGVKWVAEELRVSVKDLNKFIKEELHWLRPETEMWDGLGKITDFGIAAIYQFTWKSHEWASRFFRMVPKRGKGGLDLEHPLEAVTEFQALARMGTMAEQPTHVVDALLTRYVNAPLGERMNINHDWLYDIIGRTGAMHYGDDKALAIINKYTGRQGTSFSATQSDKWKGRGKVDRASALFPTSAKAGQLSMAKAIPDWREVGRLTAHMGWMRALGYKIGLPTADKFIKEWWSSTVVFKVGLLIKTAPDELTNIVLQHGLIDHFKARLANRSIGLVKIHNEYGQRIEILPGAQLYEISPKTGEPLTKQGMLAKAAGISPIASQNKFIWTPMLTATRRLVQLGGGSRKRLRNLAEKNLKESDRYKGQWESLPYQARKELIMAEMRSLIKGGPGSKWTSTALNNLMMFVEQKARVFDPDDLITLATYPTTSEGTVNRATEAAQKLMDWSHDSIRESIALAYSHPLIYEAATEELYTPIQHFIELGNPAATDEQLRQAATGLDPQSVLYEVPMKMVDPVTRILGKSNDETNFMNAVVNHIEQWKSEPAVVKMGEVLAHTIDAPLNSFFSGIVPDKYWSVRRSRGRVAPLPDDFVPPPLLRQEDIVFVAEEIGAEHSALGYASVKEADPFADSTLPWVNELHIDIGSTYTSSKFVHDFIQKPFADTNAPQALRTLTDMGYHEPTLLKDLVKLGIYPNMVPYSDKFLELFNVWRAENKLQPLSMTDRLSEADIRVAWVWHHEVNHIRFEHSHWSKEGWSNPALRLENETAVNQLLLHEWGVPPPKTIIKPSQETAHSVTRIISGGQTGADQAGLYAGKALGLETGGVAPMDWMTEYGESTWLAEYGLTEATSKALTKWYEQAHDMSLSKKQRDRAWAMLYMERTKMNVDMADGTIVFTEPGIDSKGSKNTIEYALDPKQGKNHPKPVLQFHTDRFTEADSKRLLNWLQKNNITTLNIAGHRASHVTERYRGRERKKKFLAVRPTKTIKMEFVFGDKKKGTLRRAVEGTTDNTFDAIKAGERTATTRKSGPQLDNMLPNDIVIFSKKVGKKTEQIHARVVTVRKTSETTPEEWAKLEGYLERDAVKNWTEGKKYGVGHSQLIFEYIPEQEAAFLASNVKIQNFLEDTLQAGLLSSALQTKGISHLDAPTLDRILTKEPNAVFLFGDNLLGKGKAGQAVVRDHPKAIGIPTKKLPSKADNAFFKDSELADNKKAIDAAFARIPPGSIVYIPTHGLGTGMAALKTKAPKTFAHLQMRINGLNPKKPVNVHHTKGEGTILSNFAETPFMFRGRQYLTAEGAYQAYKSGKHVPGFEKIKGTTAKKKGGSLTVDTKNDKNIDLMREILKEKYEQVPQFRQAVENAGVITHSVGDKFWKDKFPELLEELKTPYAQRNEWEFQGEDLAPAEMVDRSVEWAQKAHDLVTEQGWRQPLREYYDKMEAGIDKDLTLKQMLEILPVRDSSPELKRFINDLLRPIDSGDEAVASRALAFLINDKIDATNLRGANTTDVFNAQLEASNAEFSTPEGIDRLYSLRSVASQDPVIARTMSPHGRNEIETWYPQVNGEVGLHLAYLFSRYSVSGAVPLVQEMQKALIGFLTKELGNTKEAGQVFMLLNPANNPNEKIAPEVWIDNLLNLGYTKLTELHQQNAGAAIGSFRPLPPKHGLNIQAVDLLAVTANPLDAEKIRTALENWNTWLTETGGKTSSLMFQNVQPPATNLPLKRRLISKPEYQADLAFGRTHGTTETWSVPRQGYANEIMNPPSVHLWGDDWANKQGVPRGWIEEMKDDLPTGKWIREQGETPSVADPSFSEAFFGEDYPLPKVLPDVPATPPVTSIDKRLYLEEEIAILADAIMSLPTGSAVNYLYSPLAGYKEAIPSYDIFGHSVNKLVKLINQAGEEGWAVIELEREIWRVLGDMPSVEKFDRNIDYIGTVGGTKANVSEWISDEYGPGLEKFDGIRRIFKDDNGFVEPLRTVPTRDLKNQPYGDIAQKFEGEFFEPWKGVTYAEAQFGAGGPAYVATRGDAFDSGATYWPHKGSRQKDPLEGEAPFDPPSGAEIQAYFEQTLKRFTPEQMAEFAQWRRDLTTKRTNSRHFNASWPFMRNIQSSGTDPEDLILAGKDPQNYPMAFQQTVEQLTNAGIPIDLTAKEAMPTITAALVRSKMRAAVQNGDRTLWTWSTEKGAAITPADIGGFHRGIKYMSVNPRTQLLNADEAAPDPHKLQIWKNGRTGEAKYIYDDKPVPSHMTEDGSDWHLQDEQYLSKYDVRALAEDRGIKMRDELNYLATTQGRAKRMGMEINHPLLFELTDTNFVDRDRLARFVDRRQLPERIGATLPVTANTKGVKARFNKIKEGFFRGVIHHGLKGMVRQPMWHLQFHKALNGVGRYVKEFNQHSPDAYKPLEEFLNASDPIVKPLPWTHSHTAEHETNSVVQFDIPELYDFVAHVIPRLNLGNDMVSVFGHQVDQYMINSRPRSDLLKQMYDVGDVSIVVTGRDPYGLVKPGTSEYNPDYKSVSSVSFKYEILLEDSPRAEQLRKMLEGSRRSVDEWTGDVDIDGLVGTTAGKPVWEVKVTGVRNGSFYRAFPETVEHFANRHLMLGEEAFMQKVQSLTEWMAWSTYRINNWVEKSAELATNSSLPFVDKWSVRSELQEIVGTLIPFHFAHWQFLERWVKAAADDPRIIPKLNWTFMMMSKGGFLEKDEKSNQWKLQVPLAEQVVGWIGETFTQVPVVGRVFDSNMVGWVMDEPNFGFQNFIAGWNKENVFEFGLGPLANYGVTALEYAIGPEIMDDGLLGLEENFIVSARYEQDTFDMLFGAVIPKTISQPMCTLFNLMGATTICTDFAKAQVTAVMLMAMEEDLPDENTVLGDLGGFSQDFINAVNHRARDILISKTLFWEFGGTTPSYEALTTDDIWEWQPRFQRSLSSGLSYEDAYLELYRSFKADFDEDWEIVHPDSPIGGEEHLQEWYKEELKFSALLSAKTEKTVLSELPTTKANSDWLKETDPDTGMSNGDWVMLNPLANSYLMERGHTEGETEYESYAREWAIGEGLRTEKPWEDIATALFTTVPASIFYPTKLKFDRAVLELRKAEKAGIPLPDYFDWADDGPNTYTEAIARVEHRYLSWEKAFKATHPVWAATREVDDNPRAETIDSIGELLRVYEKGGYIPESEHKLDILYGMQIIYNMSMNLKSFKGTDGVVVPGTDKTATEWRDGIKTQASQEFGAFIVGRPWLNNLYYSLFQPLLQEDWLIKYEVTEQEEEFVNLPEILALTGGE